VASLVVGAISGALGGIVNVAVGAALNVFTLAVLMDAYRQLGGSAGGAEGSATLVEIGGSDDPGGQTS